MTAGDRFFRHDRYVRRERLKRRHDRRFRRLVGRRHRRGISLGALGDDALIVSENHYAGPLGNLFDLGEQGLTDWRPARLRHARNALPSCESRYAGRMIGVGVLLSSGICRADVSSALSAARCLHSLRSRP